MSVAEETTLPRICVMTVYFGPLPAWFELWASSFAGNPNIGFLVMTDQEAGKLPANARILPETLGGVREHLERALGTDIVLERAYKLCDYKPFLGLAFSDELAGYEYWGLADLEGFFRGEGLERYDKFLPLGHPFLFRSAPEVNRRTLLPAHGKELRREVVSSEANCAFDEEGTSEIYAERGFPAFAKHPMADNTIAQRHSTPGFEFQMRDGRYPASVLRRYHNYKRQVFYWKDGETGQLAIDGGRLVNEPSLYAHFQKRHFTKEMVQVRSGDDFYMGSAGFARPRVAGSML